MPLLGRRIVPPFQWRGFIAATVVLAVAVEIAWWEFATRYVSPVLMSRPWVWYAMRFAPAILLMSWALRRTQRWEPTSAAAAVAGVASGLTEYALGSLSQFLLWGAIWRADSVSELSANIVQRTLIMVPIAVILRLFLRFVVIRIDELRSGECPDCGYALGTDARIAVCPECGRKRGENPPVDFAARVWIAMQRRGRALLLLLAVGGAVWASHRITTRTLPMRAFLRAFEADPRLPASAAVGLPTNLPRSAADLAIMRHPHYAGVGRDAPSTPPLVYFFTPEPAPGRAPMRVSVATVVGRHFDSGTEPVHVDLNAEQARATIRAGGLPKPLIAELARRAELLEWKPSGTPSGFIPDGPSIDPRPYFPPAADD